MSSSSISTEKIQSFYQKVYQEADNTIHKFIIGYFILGIVISFFHNTWILGVGVGGFFMITYLVIKSRYQHTTFFRYFISFLLWNYPVQFVLQMHGMYEINLFYFISLTALLFYENWKTILIPTLYAVLTLSTLYYIQLSGAETEYLDDANLFNTVSLTVHLIIIVFYAGLCVLWSVIQRRQTHESGINQIDMEDKLKHMEANIKFADTLSQGHLTAKYSLESTDNLGESLMNMRDSLYEASKREEREKFINVGLARIGEILRTYVNNLDDLCDKVISELVTYVKANQGGIFIVNDENKKEKYLELISARAFERKKYIEKKIMPGQGLVGQCYLEKSTILITDIPDQYVNITSGLGKANPRSILLIPLVNNDEIVGVIEFASFQIYTAIEIEFLEKVGESIASTVLSAKTNQSTIKLLNESDVMTEQLRAQEEEMRQNMEELQATQEEMNRAQNELKNKESNIRSLIDNTKDTIFAIDTNYIISVVNATLKNKYSNFGIDLSPGTNILEVLPASKAAHWKQRYDRALQGEAYTEVDENIIEGKITYSETHHNPIKNNSGEIIGVSVMSRDVTADRTLHNVLKEKEIAMHSLINNTRDSIIAIDNDYKVTIVNDAIKNRYKGTAYEGIDVGANALDMLGSVKDEWKEYYDRAISGEKLNFIIKSSVKGENNFREYFIYPMESNRGNINGCSVFSREVLDHIDETKII
ncbi:MAG: GAF domain-containing protein [Cyclobacteriaceae bacterium]|nr:GAF domain-containing protein [Cyclobacteriaceae bacterium]